MQRAGRNQQHWLQILSERHGGLATKVLDGVTAAAVDDTGGEDEILLTEQRALEPQNASELQLGLLQARFTTMLAQPELRVSTRFGHPALVDDLHWCCMFTPRCLRHGGSVASIETDCIRYRCAYCHSS